MPTNDADIIVAGGGIGGLATALALARAGLRSRVLERRDVASEDGAGIQLGPNGTHVLDALGVLDALRPFAGVPDCISAFDGHTGKIITELPLGAWISKRHGAPYWVVHRVDLHAVLLGAARAERLISVEMDCAVSAIDARNRGFVDVRTSRGEVVRGRVLVGADGIWSTVRPQVLIDPAEDAPPTYFGKSAARTVIAMEHVPHFVRRDAVSLWMHPQGHLVCYPIRGGAALAVVVVCEDPTARDRWGTPVDVPWVTGGLKGFHENARALVAQGADWRVWGLHTFAPLARWVRGRVALVGDAAHPILPFLAQGGVMALEDALALAHALRSVFAADGGRGTTSVSAALEAYQGCRRARVFRVQRQSARQGRIYHMSGAGARARDLALRMGRPERLMAGYDWLYGWQAVQKKCDRLRSV